MALITCENLSLAYEGEVVVRDLNFKIHQGDYLCIVGENGSGKSTLMKGLLGLKQPHQGEITMGETANGLLRPNCIGYLPQQTAAQKDFPASVYEVVLSGRLGARGILPFYSGKDKRVALEQMEKLGILPLKKRCYRELSGGQQQRVLLCRALCAAQDVLLLDEPVSGLDPVVTGEMYRTISEINREGGVTVIMVSHDIESAAEQASHILHLNNSQLFFGTAQQYRESNVGKSFLGGERA